MKRVDPEENMDRWYMVHVQATLFEPLAVVCAWGDRRTTYQRLRILPVATAGEAEALASQIIAQKLRRGYEFVLKD